MPGQPELVGTERGGAEAEEHGGTGDGGYAVVTEARGGEPRFREAG
jgi:hypothetical protein